MSGTTLMAIGIVSGLVGRWAHNKPAIPGPAGIVKVAFAVVVIAALDQGKTQDIARGFAWLFLAAILLSDNSPLTGIAKVTNPKKPEHVIKKVKHRPKKK